MSKFEFVCPVCGSPAIVEAVIGTEVTPPICCDTEMQRVWNLTFHLHGDGWHWRPNDEVPKMDLPAIPEERMRRLE
jgi:hypothetical protein